MQKEVILKRLEALIEAPATTEEDKIILKEACGRLRSQPTFENVYKVIQLLAAVAGIANYIQHIT